MKKNTMILIITFCCLVNNDAKTKNPSYINIGLGSGLVLNADKGFLKPGLGINTGLLIPVKIPRIVFSGEDYFTVNGELMTYPHSDQPYTWMINNGIDDSFNYAKLMIGFRFATRIPEEGNTYYSYAKFKPIEGLSFEPRIGLTFFDNGNLGGAFSAQWNYIRKNVQFSTYGLYSMAKRHTNIGYNQTFAIGMSLDYTIPL